MTSDRILTVLGTAAQMPTRHRNHTGFFLRWDAYGFLFDPGEGTQRQMTFGGIATSRITHILISHFHGDHCLGLAGIVQRISLDKVAHPIDLYFPEEGSEYLQHLISASIYLNQADLRFHPIAADSTIVDDSRLVVTAYHLNHRVPALGYRIEEKPRRTLSPEKLDQLGIRGPEIKKLVSLGQLEKAGRIVHFHQVSSEKPTQSVGYLLDTGMCPNTHKIAANVDLLICEATFLEPEKNLAEQYGHLTASQAATIAQKGRVKKLLLTHFSQRYPDGKDFEAEARKIFPESYAANDLDRIELPKIKRQLK